jgi:hypothetical protein
MFMELPTRLVPPMPRRITNFENGALGGRINNGDCGVVKTQTATGAPSVAVQKSALFVPSEMWISEPKPH